MTNPHKAILSGFLGDARDPNKIPYEATIVNDGKPIHPGPVKNVKRANFYSEYDIERGTPSDPDVAQKREKIKEMMLHAWNGYNQNAFGAAEVNPHNGKPIGQDMVGANVGLTIIGD